MLSCAATHGTSIYILEHAWSRQVNSKGSKHHDSMYIYHLQARHRPDQGSVCPRPGGAAPVAQQLPGLLPGGEPPPGAHVPGGVSIQVTQ